MPGDWCLARSDNPPHMHRFEGSGNKSDKWWLRVGSRGTEVESQSNFLSNRNSFSNPFEPLLSFKLIQQHEISHEYIILKF
jgi:hypothetical protein